MDQKIVKVEELKTLEYIANLSTVLIIDMELFVKLAIITDRYLETPNEQNLGFLKEIYTQLSEKLPVFNQNRLALFSVLLKTGKIIIEHPSPPNNTIQPPTTYTSPPNNVINLFSTVDK